jgi:hypothetical protein
VEVHGAHSDSGPTSSDLWLGYLGAHVLLTPEVLVGVMGQVDWAEEDNGTTGSDADGLGWMVGPYLAAQLAGQPLYFEARAAWGQSDNSISPIGTYSDDFDTTRWLASGKVEGAFNVGGLIVSPAARVSYFNERQHSYTDSLLNPIGAQTIALGELRAGPTFAYAFGDPAGFVIVPSIGIDGVWNFGIQDANTSSGVLTGSDEVRARLNGGLTIGSSRRGIALTASGYYDGLGAESYEAFGGSARISVPLH